MWNKYRFPFQIRFSVFAILFLSTIVGVSPAQAGYGQPGTQVRQVARAVQSVGGRFVPERSLVGIGAAATKSKPRPGSPPRSFVPQKSLAPERPLSAAHSTSSSPPLSATSGSVSSRSHSRKSSWTSDSSHGFSGASETRPMRGAQPRPRTPPPSSLPATAAPSSSEVMVRSEAKRVVVPRAQPPEGLPLSFYTAPIVEPPGQVARRKVQSAAGRDTRVVASRPPRGKAKAPSRTDSQRSLVEEPTTARVQAKRARPPGLSSDVGRVQPKPAQPPYHPPSYFEAPKIEAPPKERLIVQGEDRLVQVKIEGKAKRRHIAKKWKSLPNSVAFDANTRRARMRVNQLMNYAEDGLSQEQAKQLLNAADAAQLHTLHRPKDVWSTIARAAGLSDSAIYNGSLQLRILRDAYKRSRPKVAKERMARLSEKVRESVNTVLLFRKGDALKDVENAARVLFKRLKAGKASRGAKSAFKNRKAWELAKRVEADLVDAGVVVYIRGNRVQLTF